MRKITHLVLHHTGSDHSTKQSIWRTHVLEKKWKTWGYHAGFPPAGGVDKLRPDHKPGAHVVGFNATTLGGVLYGNLDKHPATYEQWQAAVQHFANWCIEHNLDPVTAILGHAETKPFVLKLLRTKKHCPGDDVSMGEFRRDVVAHLERLRSTKTND